MFIIVLVAMFLIVMVRENYLINPKTNQIYLKDEKNKDNRIVENLLENEDTPVTPEKADKDT